MAEAKPSSFPLGPAENLFFPSFPSPATLGPLGAARFPGAGRDVILSGQELVGWRGGVRQLVVPNDSLTWHDECHW